MDALQDERTLKHPTRSLHISDNLLRCLYFFVLMASRTNKRGIAAKKSQLQKQAGRMKGAQRFTYPKRKLSLEEAKELGIVGSEVNPKGHAYNRFLKGRKICRETRLRVDPDGWRYIRTPSGGSDFVEVPVGGWLRKKLIKNTRVR